MTHQASSSYTWEPSLDPGRYIGGLFPDARISGPSDCRNLQSQTISKWSTIGPGPWSRRHEGLQHTSTCGLPGHEIVRLMDGRGNLQQFLTSL